MLKVITLNCESRDQNRKSRDQIKIACSSMDHTCPRILPIARIASWQKIAQLCRFVAFSLTECNESAQNQEFRTDRQIKSNWLRTKHKITYTGNIDIERWWPSINTLSIYFMLETCTKDCYLLSLILDCISCASDIPNNRRMQASALARGGYPSPPSPVRS